MPEDLFITSYNEATKRHAVLEDDGLTAWLYLHGPSDDPRHTGPVERACFVYNRKPAIDPGDVKKYRPKPPPIAKGYATEFAVTEDPFQHRWVLEWSKSGEAVLLTRDGQPWCLVEVEGTSKYGHCKSIKAEGPWGSPWDQHSSDGLQWGGQQGGGAHGRQPFSSVSSRCSAAAASRRSPRRSAKG
jgi:hypothetical protein